MQKLLLKVLRNTFVKKGFKSWPLMYAFAIGAVTGAGYTDFTKRAWYSQSLDPGNIRVCFSPPSGCGELIAREISKASKDLYIQAYGFTSKKIIEQVISAKARGVKINVLVDKSNLTDQYSKISWLEEAGIKVNIDRMSGIAHNKVMVIDGKKVITGSFNFTNDADKRNAENVVLIEDANLAKLYINNWHTRYAANKPS